MLYFSRWYIAIIVAISLGSIVLTLPNLWPSMGETIPIAQNLPRMPLGLDLRGGTHLLYQLDTAQLKKEWLESIAVEARRVLREDKIAQQGARVIGDQVRVTIRDPAQMDTAYEKLRRVAQPVANSLFGGGGLDIDVTRGQGNVITLAPSPVGLTERISSGVARAIETIRRRIDPEGTTESVIQRQGHDRILIQVPGREPAEVKALVGKTARLTFQLVDQTVSPAEAESGHVPPDSMVVPEQEDPQRKLALYKEVVVSGDELVDSQLAFDQRTGAPVVSFRFNAAGARRFGQVTRDNVHRPFAIVLDNQILSAPVIQEPILGGSGQISGNFTPESASRLALLLRSGALPASLEIVEERSVGPSLGSDSIEAGKNATIIGFLAISGLMIVSYGIFGLFAMLALIINITLIMAALSLLHATLTLPGIAGIVLTMGVAVDSNVLIYERIREELAAGRNIVSAVETGFSRAYGTIVDSNLTGLLAGIILYWLGSGPVRGFAVTLSLGIIASMFTAITVTRLLATAYLRWKRPAVLHI
jgi:protein-export membrane protein SecD